MHSHPTSEVTMSGTRFSVSRTIIGLAFVMVLAVSGLVVVSGSGGETDDSATVTTVGSSRRSASARSAGAETSGPTSTTSTSVAPGDDADSAASLPPSPSSPQATLPHLPPLAPPTQPNAGPLGVLNLDPADAGITGYQGLGVPALSGHGGPSSYSVGTGCASPCIDSGVAYPLGTGAHIEVVTDTPARIWIVVWNESLGHTFVSDSGAGSAVTSFEADFTELDGGTTYQAMAVAEDLNGYTDHVYGEFETLRRHVRFGLSNVVVTNQPNATVEFTTSKWADGELFSGGWEAPFPTVEDVDESVEVVLRLTAVQECEKLCAAIGGMDEIPAINAGSGWQHTWVLLSLWDLPSQNRLPIDLENTPALVENPTARTFVVTLTNGPAGGALPGDYGAPLSARVDVTVWVTYS
jgi:hypothetical protein